MVEKRITVIEQNRYLALIERPECKRRWATENGVRQPRPLPIAQLADELSQVLS